MNTTDEVNVKTIDNSTFNIYLVTEHFRAMYYILLMVWALLATIGNFLTLVVIYKYEQLQIPAHFFLCSLAMADFLCGIIGLPMRLVQYVSHNINGYQYICLIKMAVQEIITFGNILSITIIAVDRALFIAKALHYNIIMTNKRAKLIIIMMWTYSCGLILGFFVVGFDGSKVPPCSLIFVIPKLVYVSRIHIVGLLLFNIVCCSVVAWHANKQGRRVASIHYLSAKSIIQTQMKITRLLGTVLIVYMVLYIPPAIHSLMASYVYTT